MKNELQEVPKLERKLLELTFNILIVTNSIILCVIIGLSAAHELQPYTEKLINNFQSWAF